LSILLCETTFAEKAVNYLIKRLNSDCVEEAIANVAGAVGSKIRRKIECTGGQLLVIGARARVEEGGLCLPSEMLHQLCMGAYGLFHISGIRMGT